MLLWLIKKLKAKNLEEHIEKIRILALLFGVVIFGTIAFYYFERGSIEGLNPGDALYWVVVTITTVTKNIGWPDHICAGCIRWYKYYCVCTRTTHSFFY
jgi:hypothetical protein